MNKIIKIISNTLLSITIIILLLILILKLTNVIGIYKVMTGSMETGIHPGDSLLVKKQKEYKNGDIVTFKIEDTYVTHRIIKIDNDKVITKGDANNVEDEEINKDSIVGKVIYKGKLLNFIVDYKVIIVGVIILLYLISNIFSKEEKNIKKEEVEIL